MNNLRKFATEADYSAATLNYPAVSWVVSGDTVHFDRSGSTPVVSNTKVKLAFTTDSCMGGKQYFLPYDSNGEFIQSMNSITLNGEPLTPDGSGIEITLESNTSYLAEYDLKSGVTDVHGWFDKQCEAIGCSSAALSYDILFPAQVTTIDSLNACTSNFIFESTVPPGGSFSLSGGGFQIYVPDSAVNTYKNHEGFSSFASSIHPVQPRAHDAPHRDLLHEELFVDRRYTVDHIAHPGALYADARRPQKGFR